MQNGISEEFGLFFPIQMIIDLQVQKFCVHISSMNFFACLIANGKFNAFLGVHFTIFVFSLFETH
jgi:hypothetical protein